MPLAVILNDTRSDDHFGCDRVMRTLISNLESRGVKVTATSPVRADWSRNEAFIRHLAAADLVVINGEGTLHHGAKAGARLLSVLDHQERAGKPVALVNALFQDNPSEWNRWVKELSLINVRDSRSGEEVTSFGRPDVIVSLDFSLFEVNDAHDRVPAQGGIAFGDSVSPTTSSELLRVASQTPGAVFLPIRRTRKTTKPHFSPFMQAVRRLHGDVDRRLFEMRHPTVRFSRDEREFLENLGKSSLHVTGRFHGACLAVVMGVPFVGVQSNSWKIEALIADLGLSAKRLIRLEEVCNIVSSQDWGWSPEESSLMRKSLDHSRTQTARVFDELARLAGVQR